MSAFACDRCGRGLLTDADVRYIVRIQVTAAYDPLELTDEDLARDSSAEIADLLSRLSGMSQEEIEDSVHCELSFDLCATCHREYLHSPLGTTSPPATDPSTSPGTVET